MSDSFLKSKFDLGDRLAGPTSLECEGGLVLAGPPQRSHGDRGIMSGMGGIGKAMSAGMAKDLNIHETIIKTFKIQIR